MLEQGQDLLPNYASWDDLLMHGEKMWDVFTHPEEAKTTTAALLSTSGTSGLPKAAAHSHQSFIYQAKVLDDNETKTYEVSHIDPTGQQPVRVSLFRTMLNVTRSFA